MGGAKQYDRIDLLDRAVELFRRQGYSATSTAELVDELGAVSYTHLTLPTIYSV